MTPTQHDSTRDARIREAIRAHLLAEPRELAAAMVRATREPDTYSAPEVGAWGRR